MGKLARILRINISNLPPRITTIAFLLAAGSGKRLGARQPKAFVALAGKPLIWHSLEALVRHEVIAGVVIVVPRARMSAVKKMVAKEKKVLAVVSGGATRLASFGAGLEALERFDGNKTFDPKRTLILAHNAANPFVSAMEISATIEAAKKSGAAAAGRFAAATVKEVSGIKIQRTLERKKIWLAETPQIVRLDLVRRGLALARKTRSEITDDVGLAELAGVRASIVPASERNRKITTREDLAWARGQFPNARSSTRNSEFGTRNSELRVGLGQDSHPFAREKKPLVLAGVRVTPTGGLAGNSDGDVVIHALVNALSSALGGGSISNYADRLCESGVRDSRVYLEEVEKKMTARKFEIVNVSIALEAARPKLEKLFPYLKNSLSKLLSITPECVGITATSGEGLTAFGRGEGIQCFALVLLRGQKR